MLGNPVLLNRCLGTDVSEPNAKTYVSLSRDDLADPPMPDAVNNEPIPSENAAGVPSPAGAAVPRNQRDPDRPWTWGFFQWLPGEGLTLLWIVLIHVLAITGLILFPLPSWQVGLSAWTLVFLGGLGTTVAYHRALAHRAVRLHPTIETVLVFFAQFNGSGTPLQWASNHRNHHQNADTERDISSPRPGGFWWAHLRWLWQSSQSPASRYAPDLDTPRFRRWNRTQVPVLMMSLCAGLPFGWEAFFWVGAIRLCFALHGQCFVNSIAHMKKGIAPGEDSSQNLIWLGFVHSLQGENWHRNHHMHPNSARLGLRFWELDTGWWTIVVLEKLGLATHVRRP